MSKRKCSQYEAVAKDSEGTRVGVLESTKTLFLWVGRPEDDDATERVAELKRSEVGAVYRALGAWLRKTRVRPSSPKEGQR